VEQTFEGSWERRVLYEGFLDVDFAMIDLESFGGSLAVGEVRKIFQRGCRVLLDKDDWTERIAVAAKASRKDAAEAASPEAIANEIHDYWYHCVWTAKKLHRGEIWTAMHCLNCYMATKVLGMIERYTRLASETPVDTWHSGRLLETWTEPAVLRRLQGSFAGYDTQALSRALCHQMALYHAMATEVAAHVGIVYPMDAVETVQGWIVSSGSRR
jgi:aminoglycoside 6-adenylyltransferase